MIRWKGKDLMTDVKVQGNQRGKMEHYRFGAGWFGIWFYSAIVLRHVLLFATPWTVAHQVSCLISLEWVAISRSRDLHDPRIEPASLHLLHWAGRLFTTGATWEAPYGSIAVQLLSHVWLFVDPMDCSTPGFHVLTISRSLLKLMSTELVMLSNHLILCTLLLLQPSVFPSLRVFFNESALHIRRPKFWSFSFSISPSNEYSGLISFRIDWLDLLAVQGTLKSLLQHHSSNASVLRPSVFFMVPLSYMVL